MFYNNTNSTVYTKDACSSDKPNHDELHYDGVFKKKPHETKHRAILVFTFIFILCNVMNSVDTDSNYYTVQESATVVSFEELNLPESTFSTARQTLDDNLLLESHYKAFIHDYLDDLEYKYPQIDLRVFEHNLKDLSITCDEQEDTNTLGEYFADTNSIILYFSEYPPGNLTNDERNVIYHELTHAMRITHLDGNRVFQFRDLNGYGAGIDEGFTEVFTEFLLSDEQDLSVFLKEDRVYYAYDDIPRKCANLLSIVEGYYGFDDYFTKDIYTLKNLLGTGEDAKEIDDFIKRIDEYREEIMAEPECA